VKHAPNEITIQLNIDTTDLLMESKSNRLSSDVIAKYKKYCFKKNPYIFQFETNEMLDDAKDLILLRTHRANYTAVNRLVLSFLDGLDSEANLESLFNGLPKGKHHFIVCDVLDDNDSEFLTLKKESFFIHHSFEDFIPLIKKLYYSHLITPTDIRSQDVGVDIRLDTGEENREPIYRSLDSRSSSQLKSSVLLLGDTIGTATVGLLYLASYLRRHHINAYCQWNDLNDTTTLLKENIRKLMEKSQPQVVGVSMKWFSHMARVFEICKRVKEYDPSVIVVVGGNSASYYHHHIIKNPSIDYVVLGDGEKPFLDICRGEKYVSNCTYKKRVTPTVQDATQSTEEIGNNEKVCSFCTFFQTIDKREGQIIETPITYVHDEKNSSDIFLSHLDEIFVSKKDIYSVKNVYINTGKGCSLQCFYCAGGRDMQKRSFNRQKPFIRGINEVRKDLEEIKKYTSGFMFDFDLPLYDSLEYYKKIWEGIDLSRHLCEFYFWMMPSPEFIRLAAATFKYICLSIDMCSLSEPHRLKLASLGLIKPQPLDEEIVSFFDLCEEYHNVEVQVTPILGLPYFSEEDIDRGKAFISRLIDRYSPFHISWGRLHAQPGAFLSKNAAQYNMHSYAKEYDDFLYYSQLNMEKEKYPDLDTLNYPYIYSNDRLLNTKISRYFIDINKMVNQHREKFEKIFIIKRSITREKLNNGVDQLVRPLREKGVKPGIIRDQNGDIDVFKVFKAASEFYSDCERVRFVLDPIIKGDKVESAQPLLAEYIISDTEDFNF